MMTKKHFNEIARIMQDSKSKKEIINNLSHFFYTENPNFNSYRFKKACGLTDKECGY